VNSHRFSFSLLRNSVSSFLHSSRPDGCHLRTRNERKENTIIDGDEELIRIRRGLELEKTSLIQQQGHRRKTQITWIALHSGKVRVIEELKTFLLKNRSPEIAGDSVRISEQEIIRHAQARTQYLMVTRKEKKQKRLIKYAFAFVACALVIVLLNSVYPLTLPTTSPASIGDATLIVAVNTTPGTSGGGQSGQNARIEAGGTYTGGYGGGLVGGGGSATVSPSQLTLTSINPVTGVTSNQTLITISGSGFDTDLVLLIKRTNDDYRIISLRTLNENNTTLKIIVPTGMPPGIWNVDVIGPTGKTASNTSVNFTVTSPVQAVSTPAATTTNGVCVTGCHIHGNNQLG